MPKELDDATIDALTAKHGKDLETVDLDYLDDLIVLKPPTSDDWRFLKDDTAGGTPAERLNNIVQRCIVHPAQDTIAAAATKRPALMDVLGLQVTQMAGIVGEVKRKKLQRPSKTPT